MVDNTNTDIIETPGMNRRMLVISIIPIIIGAILPLWVSHGASALPMDDAYILRRYAVNLASGLGWCFNPHEISFGVTSLTFPILAAIPMKLSSALTYERVSFAFGWLSFIILIGVVEYWAWRETKRHTLVFMAGFLVAISPMGYMNAASGMESMTFALGMVGTLTIYRFRGLSRPLLMGLLASLIFLTRPEGLYLAGAIPASELIFDLRAGKRLDFKKYVLFILGFTALALPYVAITHYYTGGWLPSTYAGKIISADTNMGRYRLKGNLIMGMDYLFKGYWRSLVYYGAAGVILWPMAAGASVWIVAAIAKNGDPIIDRRTRHVWGILLLITLVLTEFARQRDTKFLAIIPIFLVFISLFWMTLHMALGAKSAEPSDSKRNAGNLAMTGLILLPFAYGAMFRAGPVFGGYYSRYILPVLPALIILVIIAAEQIRKPAVGGIRMAFIAVYIFLLAYPAYLAAIHLPSHRAVYLNESRLNGGIRLDAARWINKNTPQDSIILVGYTGLGVVGGFTDRKVLDMGALINPDIFPYYRDIHPNNPERWKRTLKYVADKKIDYFVTVPGMADRSSDPTGEAGFEEVASFSDPEIRGGFSNIEIWLINREQLR